ncbi:hypothetical protein [Acidianus sp. HS-5]|uniref:hypothetical protein n=1 Tax=Acidianus sp. HS-5 TaxID=2886040 RepID=UPI001F4569B7|nr:hypothetical protein [Acidianus sp. HS-5]BDC17669.1 hypothetical protein HS5_05590 [Acidianus sp. HS-5]
MKKIYLIFLTIVAVIGIVLLTYPMISALISPSQGLPIYNEKFGEFSLAVYNSTTLSIKNESMTGLMISLNNLQEEKLTILCIRNSTYTLDVRYFYIKESVVLSSGKVTTAFVKSDEVYIGVDTIFIPVKLSPGMYYVSFNDGNVIPVKFS